MGGVLGSCAAWRPGSLEYAWSPGVVCSSKGEGLHLAGFPAAPLSGSTEQTPFRIPLFLLRQVAISLNRYGQVCGDEEDQEAQVRGLINRLLLERAEQQQGGGGGGAGEAAGKQQQEDEDSDFD